MTMLQEYLDWKYPTKEDKKKVERIDVYQINQERQKQKNDLTIEKLEGGELNLSEYPSLEIVKIDGNYLKSPLTKLNITSCTSLKELRCSDNQLTNLDL